MSQPAGHRPCLIAVLVAALFFPLAARADDDDKTKKDDKVEKKDDDKVKKDDDKVKKDDDKVKKDDPYKLPDGGTVELLNFIKKLSSNKFVREQIKGKKSRQEAIETFQAIQRKVVEAADNVLADEKATGEQAVTAIEAKILGLNRLGRSGDFASARKMREFIKTLAKDKRPEVQEIARLYGFQQTLSDLRGGNPAAIKEAATELKKMLDSAKKVTTDYAMLAQHLVSIAERTGEKEMAAQVAQGLGERLSKEKDEDVKQSGAKLIGAARRFMLTGNQIKVTGKLLDGSEFDWGAYKGKVVLVDYWATWCGPCIQELPNVLRNYELYNKRGFEVIGISLDKDRARVEQFVKDRQIPWDTLYNDDPKANGWNHPMANYYGIFGIPTVILVDQKGKVASLNARGRQLGALLEKLIGPPEPKDKPEKDKPEKDKPEKDKPEKDKPEKDKPEKDEPKDKPEKQ